MRDQLVRVLAARPRRGLTANELPIACSAEQIKGPMVRSTTSAHDAEVFMSSWQLLYGVLVRLVDVQGESALTVRVLLGLRNIATIGAYYHMQQAVELTVRQRQSTIFANVCQTTSMLNDIRLDTKDVCGCTAGNAVEGVGPPPAAERG